jgi:SAM-dependent methyltransferase
VVGNGTGFQGQTTMSLTQIYADQYVWRRWSTIYPAVGDLSGTEVLDLGCGIGDQARDLSRQGARVQGVDANQEVIAHAVSRGIPGARFRCDSITNPANDDRKYDGVWTSFMAAYFPRFDVLLRSVAGSLIAGGWLAITEVDDIFNHEPLASRWRAVVEQYYAMSLDQEVYRFRSHDHVTGALAERGWRIDIDRTIDDDEFSFAGPGSPEVIEAWRIRLGFMMPRFLDRFGGEARGFDSALLQCLASREHRSHSRVWFVLARAPDVLTTTTGQ